MMADTDLKSVRIRRMAKEDAGPTALLFYTSVREGTGAHYNAEQRAAWASQVPDPDTWWRNLSKQIGFVAERRGEVIGFASLTQDGLIDYLFVHPEQTRLGVASRLYDSVEHAARELGLESLWTEASHLARPFFESQGWTVERQQNVVRNSVGLTNFVMTISLRTPGA